MTPFRRIGTTLLALSLLVAVSCGSEDGGNSDATATVIAKMSPTPTVSTSPSPSPSPSSTVAGSPAPTAQIDFERTGNLIRDNPGLPTGVWFLLYEEPGAPALTMELEFAAGSSCVSEARAIDCEVLEPGARVVVAGVRSEERVRVVRLEVLATP